MDSVMLWIAACEIYNNQLMDAANLEVAFYINGIKDTIHDINIENFQNTGMNWHNTLIQPMVITMAELYTHLEHLQTLPQTYETQNNILDTIREIVTIRKFMVDTNAMHLTNQGYIFSQPQMQRYFHLEFQMERFNESLEKYRDCEQTAFRLRVRREVMQDFIDR